MHFPTKLACAVALAASLTTASAQTWQGATQGSGNALQAGKTIADYNWANAANWVRAVPNAPGAAATFDAYG